jgi:hypothetical protein
LALLISVSVNPDMPFLLVQEKYTHFIRRIHPRIHPPKHGCTWMQLDA